MKKGIIFDVDGTLWDSCAVVADSWNEYLALHEKDSAIRLTALDIKGVMGKTMKEFGDILFHSLPEEKRDAVTAGCCEYEVEYMKTHGGILYPDLPETFERLAEEYHLYIVSNCQVGYIEDFIFHAGVKDLVEDFESYGNTGLTKDKNIRLLAERNELEKAVYVGDTQGDYESTCKAGLPFIYASYGFGQVDAEVPRILGLKELPEVVKKVLG